MNKTPESSASLESTEFSSSGFGIAHGATWLLIGTGFNPWLLGALLKPVETSWKVALLLAVQICLSAVGLLLIAKKRHKILHFGMLAVAISSGFALLLAEVAVRLLVPDGAVRVLRENPHSETSFRLQPNLKLTVPFQGHKIEIATNEHGMRWGKVSIEKPQDTKRIAFVGDSFTFGDWATSVQKTYVGQVQENLNKHSSREGGAKLEVLNFGVGGYGFEDMALIIEEEILRFSPDYIVVGMFTGNDFRDTWLGPKRGVVSNGILIANTAWINERIPTAQNSRYGRAAKDKSRLKILVENVALLKLLRRVTASRRAKKPKKSTIRNYEINTTDFTAYTFWNQIPYPEVANKAVDASKKVLQTLHAKLKKSEVKLIVVSLPTQQQIYNTTEKGDGFDMKRPQVLLEETLQESGVPYFDLLPSFRNAAKASPTPEFFAVPDIHYNDKGHAFAGKLIADFLLDEISASSALTATTSVTSGPNELK